MTYWVPGRWPKEESIWSSGSQDPGQKGLVCSPRRPSRWAVWAGPASLDIDTRSPRGTWVLGSEAVRGHELGPRTQESPSASQTTRIGAHSRLQVTVGWMLEGWWWWSGRVSRNRKYTK